MSNTPKTNSEVPEQNILDLRQILAERQARTETGKSSRWPLSGGRLRLRRREQPTLSLARPVTMVIAWSKVRRETVKFIAALVFGVLPLLLIVTVWQMTQHVKAVTADTRTAFESLQQGATSLGAFHIPEARRDFQRAADELQQANDQLQKLSRLPATTMKRLPIVGKKYITAEQILQFGRHLASAGLTFSTILPEDQQPIPSVTVTSNGLIEGSIGILKPLSAKPDEFRQGLDELLTALETLIAIDAVSLPTTERQAVQTYQRLAPALLGSPHTTRDTVELLLALLTPEEPKEYLVIFQNNDEIRATGGFAGTFLLVKFDRGMFTILDAPGTGPFDLTTRNKRDSLPPQPILAVAPYWTFHDANWFLDVPTSADFMLDFYQQARGFRPGGMVFLTPMLVEDLLKITGPIRPDKYQVDITADNFVRATEQQVEFGYDKALNNPKQFLIDLVPALITKLATLTGSDGWQAVGSVIRRINESDVLFYSQDEATADTIRRLGWDGSIKKPADQEETTIHDYLAVVDTNLGGGKTDRVIDTDVNVAIAFEPGRAVHTVTVKRKHNGLSGDALTGTTNRNFIRVYAPANAEFMDINGASIPPDDMFKIPEAGAVYSADLDAAEGRVLFDVKQGIRLSHENGLNVFGAWSIIGRGQSQTLKFIYATPLPELAKSSQWSLLWQKQPGAPTRQWSVSVNVGKSRTISSFLPTNGNGQGKSGVKFKTDSTVSRTFGIVFN